MRLTWFMNPALRLYLLLKARLWFLTRELTPQCFDEVNRSSVQRVRRVLQHASTDCSYVRFIKELVIATDLSTLEHGLTSTRSSSLYITNSFWGVRKQTPVYVSLSRIVACEVNDPRHMHFITSISWVGYLRDKTGWSSWNQRTADCPCQAISQ